MGEPDDKPLATRIERRPLSPTGDEPLTPDEKSTPEMPVSRNVSDILDDDPELLADTLVFDPASGNGVGLRDQYGAPLDLSGMTMASYNIVKHLGAGGMGDVYVAVDTRLDRQVALKVLPPHMAAEESWLERFKTEAKALAALNHPNIVTIHSVEQVGGLHFLTMELIQGRTLREVAEDGILTLEDFLDIAKDLSAGLARAHENGIVHRDLKPHNVMLTDDGLVKILDFGLAKLVTQETVGHVTAEIVGTVAYMSPEQIQGDPVDARSDIFSVGMMLYEMVTGQRPFQTKSELEHLTAVISWDPTPITEIREELPLRLQQIIDRCMEKEADDRYANGSELYKDIDYLIRDIRDESLVASRLDIMRPELQRTGRTRFMAAAAALVLALTVAFVVIRWQATEEATVAGAKQGQNPKTAAVPLAVLFFQNLSGDEELDWLSNGLTEMLVTDLSQSPGLNVLSTSRLHRTLQKLDALDEKTLSVGLINSVAQEADVEAVALGSFVRLGETLQVSFTVEDVTNGDIVISESVSGQGEESIIEMVEELGARVREFYEADLPPLGPTTLAEATSSSVEAWEMYTEALKAFRRSSWEEAKPLYEKALEIDPGFAMAHASLARVHQSRGDTSQARIHARQAIEHIDRMPLDQKFNIEGSFYGTSWATLHRAIESYKIGLGVYPNRSSWRNSLARRYAFLERYPEAIGEFRKLIESPSSFRGNFLGIAQALAALGEEEEGLEILREYTAANPDQWISHYYLAWYHIDLGRLDEAEELLAISAGLDDSYRITAARWRLAILRKDWSRAESEANQLVVHDDPTAQRQGAVAKAQGAIYQGRFDESLSRFDEAISRSSDADRALIRCWKAMLLLELERYDEALSQALMAQKEGRDEWPELRGLFLEALVYIRLDQPEKVTPIISSLREFWRQRPNAVEERQVHFLEGIQALASEKPTEGVEHLQRAAALLPRRGIEFHFLVYPDHVLIWKALGQAELAADSPEAAESWLKKVTESGSEHIERPIPYIQAHRLMSQVYEKLGRSQDAQDYRQRYRGFWNTSE